MIFFDSSHQALNAIYRQIWNFFPYAWSSLITTYEWILIMKTPRNPPNYLIIYLSPTPTTTKLLTTSLIALLALP